MWQAQPKRCTCLINYLLVYTLIFVFFFLQNSCILWLLMFLDCVSYCIWFKRYAFLVMFWLVFKSTSIVSRKFALVSATGRIWCFQYLFVMRKGGHIIANLCAWGWTLWLWLIYFIRVFSVSIRRNINVGPNNGYLGRFLYLHWSLNVLCLFHILFLGVFFILHHIFVVFYYKMF